VGGGSLQERQTEVLNKTKRKEEEKMVERKERRKKMGNRKGRVM
jgi:hypothetical protein